MTSTDTEWFLRCHSAGLVRARMLEVGSAKVQAAPNLCEIATKLGVGDAIGADLEPRGGVDLVLDFGLSPQDFQDRCRESGMGTFATVCVFNVLEHTFDPTTVLSNALSCLEPQGALLVVTPAVWPIHRYPRDHSRLLPDWYLEFAERHHLNLFDEHFCWLSEFGVTPIRSSDAELPTYRSQGRRASWSRYWISRLSHRLLNTYGRSHWATHVSVGAAFVRE